MPWKNPGDRAFGYLASTLSAGATSLTLANGQGDRFASLGTGDWYYGLLVDEASSDLDDNWAFVKFTAKSADTFTIVMGVLGSDDKTFPRAGGAPQRVKVYASNNIANLIGLITGGGVKASAAAVAISAFGPRKIFLSPTAGAINQPLPSTDIWQGWDCVIVNTGTKNVAVQASGGSTVLTLPPGYNVTVQAGQDAPTASTHWSVVGTYVRQADKLSLLQAAQSLSAALVLTADDAAMQNVDCNGADRPVILPPTEVLADTIRCIRNVGSANVIRLLSSNYDFIANIHPGGFITVQSDSTAPAARSNYKCLGRSRCKEVFISLVAASCTAANDTIDFGSAHGMYPCAPFQISANAPAGLSLATTYYVIPVDSTHVKAALSAADALAGTAVDITGSATPTLLTYLEVPLGAGPMDYLLGGGGGSGGKNSSSGAGGAGGSSGAIWEGKGVVVAPDETIAVTVGVGGDNASGGDSTLVGSVSGTIKTAKGGPKGGDASGTTGGAAGAKADPAGLWSVAGGKGGDNGANNGDAGGVNSYVSNTGAAGGATSGSRGGGGGGGMGRAAGGAGGIGTSGTGADAADGSCAGGGGPGGTNGSIHNGGKGGSGYCEIVI